MRSTIVTLSLFLGVSTSVLAGPQDPSKFDATPYTAQKALYDFNFAQPLEGKQALGFVKNHLKAMKEYGDLKNSHIVVVAHGNELHAFSRLNQSLYKDMYDELKALKDQGVTFTVCANAAKSRGYKPEDFYDVITVVPAAVIDIAKWQNQGYSYIYPAIFPRITRDALVAKHPELEM